MSKKVARIFLVEDDLSFGCVLKSYLEINDFSVDLVDDGKMAIDVFRRGVYDLCILDVMLPHVDGFTIAAEVRSINSVIPIIFLTAKKLKEDLLKGYGVGADDYITKPFDTDILLCKIKALILRRDIQDGSRDIYEIGKFIFNARLRTLTMGKFRKENSLQRRGSSLMLAMAARPTRHNQTYC